MHLLQIWLLPNRNDVDPRYAQRHFPAETGATPWRCSCRRTGATVYRRPSGRPLFGALMRQVRAGVSIGSRPQGLVHVARGAAQVNGELLRGGDAARIDAGDLVRIEGVDAAEVLLFDLP